MDKIVHYNFLNDIIQKIEDVVEDKKEKEIVWFGSTNYVPILNTYLWRKGRNISCVLDNNKNKWEKKVNNFCQFCDSSEFESLPPEIIVDSPESISDKKNNIIVFIISRYQKEMTKQLLDIGVPEGNIICLPKEIDEYVLKKPEIREMLIKYEPIGIEEVKKIQLNILRNFKKYCDENGLEYFLLAGTLLGAVRHKGYIPWDDDIDVAMPLPDYIKFLNSYPKDGKYRVTDWENDDSYTHQFARIIDTDTLAFHNEFHIQIVSGVFIDVFPFAGYPDGEKERKAKTDENLVLNEMWTEYYCARDILSGIEDPRAQIMKKKCFEYDYDKSNYVGLIHTQFKELRWTIEKEKITEKTEMMFEGEKYKVPIDYDKCLTLAYGDYMTPPDEKDRVLHSVTAYKKIK